MSKQLPYRFDDKERKILFDRYDLPSPWINYLSNGRMHAFVSQAGGGMCWYRSPMSCRITRYRFYNLPIDSPGFYVYIRMKNGSVWSPTFRPCETKPDKWQAAHAPGYSEFTAEKDGLQAKLTLFMAQDNDVLLWNLQLTNNSGENTECDVFAYVEFSEFDFLNEVKLDYYLKWQTSAKYEKDLGAITYRFSSFVSADEKMPVVYFYTDGKVDSYCCNRDVFCGNYRDERNPVEVEMGVLSDTDLSGGEPCGALHTHLSLKTNEKKTVNYYLGVTTGEIKDEIKAIDVAEQFQKNAEWWETHLGIYQCEIPDGNAQRQINIWNPIQSVVTARFSRSISSAASGIRGIGFRDTAQDMLAQAYRKPEWARDMLYYLASQQFKDGSTVHQSWPHENRLPQVVIRSDNHIWMSYLAYAIIAETGDLSILDKDIPFLHKDLQSADGTGTLWEHLMRGIEFTESHKGEHGLPLILFSDWNDHIGPFGRKGKGESVFVSQQHIYQLKLLSEIAEVHNDSASVERFGKLIKEQEDALDKYCWDGEWYLRALDDDGKPVGTHTADYARLWVNTQSWNIIAGVGTKEHNERAMNSVQKHLDTGLGLLINYPGLPEAKANSLPKGYSENGGVFCQANCWAIMAEALLGRGDNAWNYYKQLIPHEIIEKIGVENYKNEAYAYSSTMLGPENKQFGQACVSQVTGTAAWMDVVSTQYILGVRPTAKGLLLDPSIPSEWNGYRVKRLYRGCELDIAVENPNGVQHGVKEVYLDGKRIDGRIITPEMIKNKSKTTVKVVME